MIHFLILLMKSCSMNVKAPAIIVPFVFHAAGMAFYFVQNLKSCIYLSKKIDGVQWVRLLEVYRAMSKCHHRPSGNFQRETFSNNRVYHTAPLMLFRHRDHYLQSKGNKGNAEVAEKNQ